MITVQDAVREFGGRWQSPKSILVIHDDDSYEFCDAKNFTGGCIICSRLEFEEEAERQALETLEGFTAYPPPGDTGGFSFYDPVNRPEHYTSNGIECIDAITEALGREGAAMFCRGNVIKYSWRADKKGTGAQDMMKAAWYANKAAELMK